MGRVIGPYVSGGGGMQNAMKNYNVNGGGFQQMTSDMITAMRDVPFSIPPYFVRARLHLHTQASIFFDALPLRHALR